jgi:hypothetical protein
VYSQSNGSSSLLVSKLESVFKIRGNFVIQVDFDMKATSLPDIGQDPFTAMFKVLDSVSGNWVGVGGARSSEPSQAWYHFIDGTSDAFSKYWVASSTYETKHRLVRVGSTLTAFIWNSSSGRWEWDGNVAGHVLTTTLDDDVYVRYEIDVSQLSRKFDAWWDNFKINSGDVIWDTYALPFGNTFEKYIAVTQADGITEQYVEIDYSDIGSSEFGVHTKVPTLSSSVDTVVYLYWDSTHTVGDNPMVGNTGEAAAKNVWDADYYGVWHINDLALKDSTANVNNFSQDNMDAGDFQITRPGKGTSFNGINERLKRNISVSDYPITMEGYGIVAGNPAGQVTPTVSIGDTEVNYRNVDITLYQNEARLVHITSLPVSASMTTTERNYQVGDFAGLAGVLVNTTSRHVIGDGVEKVVNTDSLNIPASIDKLMAGAGVGPNPDDQDGLMSEVRVSLIARSDAWLKATYGTLNGTVEVGEEDVPFLTEQPPVTIKQFSQDIAWNIYGFGDSYFNVDPITRLTVVSDVYQNTRYNVGGNVWYDVIDESKQDTSWDILHSFLQNTSWAILNENHQDIAWDIINVFAQNIAWSLITCLDQDIAWTIFPKILGYVQRFVVDAICFNFGIELPVDFNYQIKEPLDFTFYPTGTIDDSIYLEGETFDTILMESIVNYDFQIKEPVKFTFGIQHVMTGLDPTEKDT